MSKPQKIKKPTVSVVTKEPEKAAKFEINKMLFHAADSVLKGIAVLAASNVLSQPQFAYQASQAGLVELADVLFKYMNGQINSVPAATPDTEQPATPTFGQD